MEEKRRNLGLQKERCPGMAKRSKRESV